MAEALGAAGSIVGIVAFGLQLAVTLQTYVEAVAEANDRLREVAFDVNSTAAMLKQLQGLIEEDRNSDTPLFNVNGVRDVERLSKKCNKIYSGIVILLNKASEDGDKGQIKMETTADAIPDASIKAINLSFRRKMAWSWLEPRINRCQQELRQVKLDLLLQVQVITLAQFKIKFVKILSAYLRLCIDNIMFRHPIRAPTILQEEQDVREIATKLMQT
ncbi:hypothetical protein FALBO_8476 [Fusarium albosuccineum]|uniref:Fungal N-terminal domain-containing protein n=1 Tax=Fusarium albosuccineum TaxID=1237068 RepID=A0A8H4LAQ6_9HYPO|nr:hypothetical protein FALBO_8476 [Fusarium albosuccineum]